MFANINHTFGDHVLQIDALFGYALDNDLNDSRYVTMVHAQNYLIVAFIIN